MQTINELFGQGFNLNILQMTFYAVVGMLYRLLVGMAAISAPHTNNGVEKHLSLVRSSSYKMI